MKKLFLSVLMLTALFLTVQTLGQEYQTKGSGDNTKQMKDKTSTVKSTTTTSQSEVSPTVKTPESEKKQGKASTTIPEQKTGTVTSTQTKGTGGTMTSATASQTGKIYDAEGDLFATIDKDGWIRNPKNRLIGQYTKSGEYFNKNRVKAATIHNGEILDRYGSKIGKIGQDGKVYDASGKMLGTIADDGKITDSQGKQIGSAPGVDKNVALIVFFYQNSGSSVKSGKK